MAENLGQQFGRPNHGEDKELTVSNPTIDDYKGWVEEPEQAAAPSLSDVSPDHVTIQVTVSPSPRPVAEPIEAAPASAPAEVTEEDLNKQVQGPRIGRRGRLSDRAGSQTTRPVTPLPDVNKPKADNTDAEASELLGDALETPTTINPEGQSQQLPVLARQAGGVAVGRRGRLSPRRRPANGVEVAVGSSYPSEVKEVHVRGAVNDVVHRTLRESGLDPEDKLLVPLITSIDARATTVEAEVQDRAVSIRSKRPTLGEKVRTKIGQAEHVVRARDRSVKEEEVHGVGLVLEEWLQTTNHTEALEIALNYVETIRQQKIAKFVDGSVVEGLRNYFLSITEVSSDPDALEQLKKMSLSQLKEGYITHHTSMVIAEKAELVDKDKEDDEEGTEPEHVDPERVIAEVVDPETVAAEASDSLEAMIKEHKETLFATAEGDNGWLPENLRYALGAQDVVEQVSILDEGEIMFLATPRAVRLFREADPIIHMADRFNYDGTPGIILDGKPGTVANQLKKVPEITVETLVIPSPESGQAVFIKATPYTVSIEIGKKKRAESRVRISLLALTANGERAVARSHAQKRDSAVKTLHPFNPEKDEVGVAIAGLELYDQFSPSDSIEEVLRRAGAIDIDEVEARKPGVMGPLPLALGRAGTHELVSGPHQVKIQ